MTAPTGSRRHSALSADADAGARGAIRVSQLRRAPRRAERGSPVWWTRSEPGESVGTASPDARWVTIAFTCNGLRALGVDDSALATFPEEFRQGMAARAEILGIAGDSGPDRWVGDLASPALHAIVILFARDVAERDRCERQHRDYLSTLTGVTVLSALEPRSAARRSTASRASISATATACLSRSSREPASSRRLAPDRR